MVVKSSSKGSNVDGRTPVRRRSKRHTPRRVRLTEYPLLLVVLAAFGLWILFQILQQAVWVLMLVLLSSILATAMMPGVRLVRRPSLPRLGWRLPKALAVLAIYALVAAGLGLMAYTLGTILVTEARGFAETLPEIMEDVLTRISQLEQELGLPGLIPSPGELGAQMQALAGQAAQALRWTGIVLEGAIEFGFRLFIVLALALFMVIEAERISTFWVSFFPVSQRDRVAELTASLGDKIGYWILGRLAVAVITGIMAGVAAALLGLPYPLLIGVVTGVLDFAPVVGPTLMVFPVFLLGLAQSGFIAILGVLVFLAIAEIDGSVLSPMIEGRAVRLSPVLILIAVPFGLAVYGIIGAVVAVPVSVALQLITLQVILPWLHKRQEAAE
jgi:predicted PurR-regulated permease PerM